MFLFYKPSRLALEPTQPPVWWVQEFIFLPGVKRPGREVSFLRPCSAEVKNVWSGTSPPVYLRGVDRDSCNCPDRRSMLIYPAAIFFVTFRSDSSKDWYVRPCLQIQADLCSLFGVCAYGFSPDRSHNEPHSANSFVTTYCWSRSQSIFIPFWTQKFIIVFIAALQWFLCWAWWIRSAFCLHYFSWFRNYSSILLESSKRSLCFKLCE
jgi:hypothetical protein